MRGGLEGAEGVASSENSLPMAGAAKLRAVLESARGGKLLSPPLTSYAAVAKVMGYCFCCQLLFVRSSFWDSSGFRPVRSGT